MSVLQDIRLALRLFRRTPSVTAIALQSIALSVAATSVVFTAIKAVVLDPLPYANSSELVQIATDFANARQSNLDWVFWNDLQAFTARNRTLESVAYFSNAAFDLSGDTLSPPEAVYGLRVSANLFPALGVAPTVGRNITPDDDPPGASNVIILSHGLWRRSFQADANIVGRDIKINGQGRTIIGVMPADFNFPLRRTAARTPHPYVEFWAPMQADATKPKDGAMGAAARLRNGVSHEQARTRLDVMSPRAAVSTRTRAGCLAGAVAVHRCRVHGCRCVGHDLRHNLFPWRIRCTWLKSERALRTGTVGARSTVMCNRT